MSNLRLAVLGSFSLSAADAAVEQFRTNRVQALLTYLVIEAGRGDRVKRRDSLIDLLWPGMPTTSGLQNLRQTLYQLRKQLPDTGDVPLLLTNRKSIQINPEYLVTVDATQFETLLSHHPDHWVEAIDLYRGAFLKDFYLPDAATFNLWVAERRADYQRQALDALTSLADIQIEQQAYQEAIRLAQRQLNIDPLREKGHQQLMIALARDGQRAEALRHYEQCQTLFETELAVPVSKTTADLAETIRGEGLPTFGRTRSNLGGYDLKEMIGSGNFGSVYRGIQTSIGREVAVKIIRDKYANDPDFIRRFEAEAQIVARLEHPHIVPLYDFWREPGSAYLVMRWLRSGSLADNLNGGWALEKALTIIQQVSQALHTAHEQGVIHRDVKAANILLDEAGNGYLSDFGIALADDGTPVPTSSAEMLLSATSVSPEQMTNQPLTPLSDIYSLGVTTYELLTGQAPFAAESPLHRAYLHAQEPLPSLLASRPALPATLDAVIQTATAKKPSERYATTLAFAQALHEAVGSSGTATFAIPSIVRHDIANPYKGLEAFGEADTELFFGRNALIDQLAEKIAQDRFLAVVGPSGSGKSSVVRAGVIPKLREGFAANSQNWFITDMLPSTHPFEELENALLRVAVDSPDTLLSQLKDGDRGIARAVKRVLPPGSGQHLLLVIDQFEELFTLAEDADTTRQFLKALYQAVTDEQIPIRVLVTLRADFYDRPLHIDGFNELMRQHTAVITPLTSITDLTAAIQQPAALVGVTIEPDLVATIVSDVQQQAGALPLLQYALTELFEQRQGNMLTLAEYQAIGGILGSLARRADEIYQSLTPEQQPLSKQLFMRLVTLGEGVEDTRRRVLQSELQGLESGETQATSHLAPFGAARLLSFDHDPVSREPTVEVAHEALLREWPRLRGWLDESRGELRLQRLLGASAGEWVSAEKDNAYLLRGSRLDQFGAWADSSDIALTSDEQALLDASFAEREKVSAEESARQQRELEQAQQLAETERKRAEEQTSAAGRLRQRAYLLAGALAIAGILAIAAFISGNRATDNANIAATERAQANANAALASTREREAQDQAILAEENADLAALREVEAEEQAVLAQENAELARTREAQAVSAQATAQSEAEVRAIAQANAEEQARLAIAGELSARSADILASDAELSLLLSMKSLDIAYTSGGESMLHRALQANRLRERIPLQTGFPVEIAKNGSFVAFDDNDSNTLKVWNIETEQLLFETEEKENSIWAELALDESFWVVGHCFDLSGFDCELEIYDAESGEFLPNHISSKRFTLDSELTSYWSYTPSHEHFLVSYLTGLIEIESWAGNDDAIAFAGHTAPIERVSFDQLGNLMVSSDVEDTIILWDLAASLEQQTAVEIARWQSENATTFSWKDSILQFDDKIIVLLAEGDSEATSSSMTIWEVVDGEATKLGQTPVHGNRIRDIAVSADRTLLATGSSDSTIKIVDLFSGEEYFSLSGSRISIAEVEFIGDSTKLMSVDIDGGIILWDATPILHETKAIAEVPIAIRAALSPDDMQLAVGNAFGPASIFDTNTGELIRKVPDSIAGMRAIRYNPDGSKYVGGGYDGMLRIWDTETGDLTREWQAYERVSDTDIGSFWPGIWDVSFSPDGKYIASVADSESVDLWDAETGEHVRKIADSEAFIWRTVFSRDGKHIAINDRSIKVFDVQTGALVWEADVAETGPALAYSNDGRLLVSGGNLGAFDVWDAQTGERAYETPSLVGFVQTAEFTPDDQFIITSDNDSLSVWDGQTGEYQFELVDRTLGEIAMMDNGRFFSTAFQTGAIAEFTVYLEDALAVGRERLTREMTEQECLQYLRSADCEVSFGDG